MDVGWFFAAVAACCAVAGWLEAIRIHHIDERHIRQRDALREEAAQARDDKALARLYWEVQIDETRRLEKECQAAYGKINQARLQHTADVRDRDEEIARLKQQLADVVYEVRPPRAKRGASKAE